MVTAPHPPGQQMKAGDPYQPDWSCPAAKMLCSWMVNACHSYDISFFTGHGAVVGIIGANWRRQEFNR